MTVKYSKQKQVADDNIHYLKKDNEGLKNKILEVQQVGHMEIVNLQDKLTHFHESQRTEMMMKHEGQIRILTEEIEGLKGLIQAKNNEIEQLIKEKVTNRNLFDAELGKVKDDYAMVLQKYKDQEIKLSDINTQSATRLNDRDKHIQYLEDLLREQKTTSEN